MTRLFLRFYLGVICLLLVALFVLGNVLFNGRDQENAAIVEDAMAGGLRLAVGQLNAAADSVALAAALTDVAEKFEYPITLRNDIPEDPQVAWAIPRLRGGEVVLSSSNGKLFLLAWLVKHDLAVQFGPLPSLVGPSQAEWAGGFALIFAVTAVGIALLLRPIAVQLLAVERTAKAIATGDLSARIAPRKAASRLPMAKSFNHMAERIEDLLDSQQELLQAVSHELRTPLARIRFAADLVESAKDDKERAERLQAVDRATSDLDALVGELLTYIRLDSASDKLPRAIEPVELAELVEEIIAQRQPLLPNATLQLELARNCEHLVLECDRLSLSRAIGNLVGNAGKFAQQRVRILVQCDSVSLSDAAGNGTMVAANANIEPSQQAKANYCYVHVDDDGPGVPPEDRVKIFVPFVRLPNSPGRGSGLGLALVDRIARRIGGRVEVATSPLGGARFTLTLPLHGAENNS